MTLEDAIKRAVKVVGNLPEKSRPKTRKEIAHAIHVATLWLLNDNSERDVSSNSPNC